MSGATPRTRMERGARAGVALGVIVVLGFVAVGSFGSGALLDAFGWNAVQYAMLPALLVALAGVASVLPALPTSNW